MSGVEYEYEINAQLQQLTSQIVAKLHKKRELLRQHNAYLMGQIDTLHCIIATLQKLCDAESQDSFWAPVTQPPDANKD